MGEHKEYEPTAWLLIFHTSTTMPRLDRWLPGRFKHVSAIAWVEAGDTWITYDVHYRGTRMRAVPGEAGRQLAARILTGNGVLRVPVAPGGAGLPKLAFWCVPAMKHLVGSRSGALLPDRLWRYLVATGAEIIQDVRSEGEPDRDRRRACRG